MSSSEDYLRGLVREGPADWGAAVRYAADSMGKGATRWLAGVTGSAGVRSPERWVAMARDTDSQKSTPKPAAQVAIVEAVKLKMAADHIRQADTAHCGRVDVKYPDAGRDEGHRDINDQTLDATSQGEIADKVEAGDLDAAAELLDAAVLAAYGVPEGALEITDYQNGIWLD